MPPTPSTCLQFCLVGNDQQIFYCLLVPEYCAAVARNEAYVHVDGTLIKLFEAMLWNILYCAVTYFLSDKPSLPRQNSRQLFLHNRRNWHDYLLWDPIILRSFVGRLDGWTTLELVGSIWRGCIWTPFGNPVWHFGLLFFHHVFVLMWTNDKEPC